MSSAPVIIEPVSVEDVHAAFFVLREAIASMDDPAIRDSLSVGIGGVVHLALQQQKGDVLRGAVLEALNDAVADGRVRQVVGRAGAKP